MISPLLVLEHLTTSPPLALNGAGGEDRMIRLLVKAIPLITTILLIACGSNTPVDSEQEGRILLWHQWSGADEETLNELLDMFNEVLSRDNCDQHLSPVRWFERKLHRCGYQRSGA